MIVTGENCPGFCGDAGCYIWGEYTTLAGDGAEWGPEWDSFNPGEYEAV